MQLKGLITAGSLLQTWPWLTNVGSRAKLNPGKVPDHLVVQMGEWLNFSHHSPSAWSLHSLDLHKDTFVVEFC
jgi:hypothetical protein